MKVVLLKDVDKLGEADHAVNVADGYARNFLFPRKLAVVASKTSLAAAQKRLEKLEADMEARRAELQAQADSLGAQTITITVDAGENGKLFGSVTAQDIAAQLPSLDKKKIELKEPIKNLGEYSVPFKLFKDIGGKIRVNVVPKGAA